MPMRRPTSPSAEKFWNLRCSQGLVALNQLERDSIMKTRLLPVLLLTAAFPLAAVAQDTGTPPGTTPETTPGTTDTTPGVAPTQPTDDTNSTTDPSGTTQPDTTSPAATPAPSTDDTGPATDGSSAAPTDQSASTTTGDTFVTVPETGAWRVSDLQGKTVYGSEGSNIGEISDVLVSQNGSVNAVIIGVGGFLGIGQKDVAVNISALQLGPGDTQEKADAVANSMPDTTTAPTGAVPDASATPGQDTTAMGGAGVAADQPPANPDVPADTAKIGDDALPDRIILNVTREELEKAPAFEGVQPQ